MEYQIIVSMTGELSPPQSVGIPKSLNNIHVATVTA